MDEEKTNVRYTHVELKFVMTNDTQFDEFVFNFLVNIYIHYFNTYGIIGIVNPNVFYIDCSIFFFTDKITEIEKNRICKRDY